MPTIRDVLDAKGRDVVTIRPDATIREAVEALVEHRIGCLVVSNGGDEVAGILTERDILKIVSVDAERLVAVKVAERMSTDVVCGVPDDDLDYVMSIMTSRRCRRMPVMENGKLAGLVSIGDVVKAMKSATEYEVRQLKDYIGGGYA